MHIAACTDRDMITDERSEYHLQSACLVLAAHRVMTKQLNMDRGRSIEAIKQVRVDDELGISIHKSCIHKEKVIWHAIAPKLLFMAWCLGFSVLRGIWHAIAPRLLFSNLHISVTECLNCMRSAWVTLPSRAS